MYIATWSHILSRWGKRVESNKVSKSKVKFIQIQFLGKTKVLGVIEYKGEIDENNLPCGFGEM